MAKYTKVRFLKYFNRPIVFVAIEIDTIGMFFLSAFILYFALSLTSVLSPYFSFLTSFGLGLVVSFYYSKYKNEAPKGFLKHLLYVMHIYRVKGSKYEESKRMDIDVDDYYPKANIKDFYE